MSKAQRFKDWLSAMTPERRQEYARKVIQRVAEWRKQNGRRFAAENSTDAARVRKAKWKKQHTHLVAKDTQNRNAKKLQATPDWANEFFISEAYHIAKVRTRHFGFKWHVDHIVPLRSKAVCGLHVESNLQVIPAVENMKKGNRQWPDMP